ncbi:hypothetical protein BP6252_10820 [Coleophoma cylindrospora]|uniref:Uncharacterized protein n=1 Tax=Coleophoma cylindrospora TaxID=1849047 RepID=A0A3D8QNA0_9HELO|nr:hypothetical protein BP6252_10820 [Coleophoma cylindrospora]
MSAKQTYSLAHTARCKLQLAADRPDRNLRFILGHAFTLDNLKLRLAEIETNSTSEERDSLEDDLAINARRRASFRVCTARPSVTRDPGQPPRLEDSDSSSDSDEEVFDDDEDEDEGLSLRRFESASAKPPQMIVDDDDDSSSEEDEPASPPTMPSEEELKMITGGEANEELSDLYEHVAGCPCHGHRAPHVSKMWDVPQKPSHEGARVALVQVAA